VWLSLFEGFGYTVYEEKPTFLQFTAPPNFVWPVDLMFVNEATWSKMMPEAVWVSIGEARCKVPKLQHLIALKFHALKHTHAGRFVKDFQDVVCLIQVNRLDLASVEIRKYSSSMEPANSMKKSAARAAETETAVAPFKSKPPELDFPVDPSFDPQPPRLDPEAMFR